MTKRAAGKKWSDDALGFKAMGFAAEVRFHAERKWRYDFAHALSKVAVEINGGIFMRGSGAHNGSGHLRDMEKLNAAQELGWVVLQYQPGRVDWNQISRVVSEREKALTKDMQAGSIRA